MKKKTRRQKRGWKTVLKNKRTVLIIVSLLVVGLLVYFFVFSSSTTIYEAIPHTVAIIDQLALNHPNATFIQNINNTLTSAGFSVDYYNYSEVTVDFYRQLPSKRYSLIILRVHSGVGWFTGLTSLYTSEPYNEWAHYLEQTKDQVVPVQFELGNESRYFAITSNFVNALDSCRNSVVIMMGCDGLRKTDMAKAFIARGASVYVSWNGSVSPEHTDKATEQILRNIVAENQSIGEAVSNVMDTTGPDPNYQSRLEYYPSEAQDYIITETPQNSQRPYSLSLDLSSFVLGVVAGNRALKK